MRTHFTIIAFIITTITGFAQQDSQFTQYMYNTITINPAYAGSRGTMSIFGMYRRQWVGLEGAPKTAIVSVNTPINNSAIGLGLSFVNDQIGPSTQNTISADASYSIEVSDDYKVSFGLKASANLLNLDINKLNIQYQDDPQFQNLNMTFSPNIGAGIYVHSEKVYFGISVPNFLETKHFRNNSTSIAQRRLHYYGIAGYIFELNDAIKFKPATLLKAVVGAPLQMDISGNFLINEKLVLGLAYRSSNAVSALAGFHLSDSLYIGYAYDAETTRLTHYNSGSHEIFLRFDFFSNPSRVLTPRFF